MQGRRRARFPARAIALVAGLTAFAALMITPSDRVPMVGAEPAAAGDPAFALLAQPAWVPVGGDVTLRLDVPAALLPPDEDVQLRLRVHDAVTTAATFERSIEGERLGFRIDSETFPLTALVRDAQGAVYVTFGLSGSATSPALAVSEPGVYPLEVALRTDETLAAFVTWIVVADPAGGTGDDTDAAEGGPVRLASVWNVSSAPLTDPDGTPGRGPGAINARAVADLVPGGRLADIAQLLDDAAAMPVTLQVGPETLEAWDSLAQADPTLGVGVASVKEAVRRPINQLLPAPYVPIDLTSLTAAGLGSELPDQLRTGSQVLDRLTSRTPDVRTAFVDPIDPTVGDGVRGLLVDRLVVRAPSIADIDREDTLTPFEVSAGSGTLRAAATSPAYEGLLEGDASAALRAQRLLAALSVLTFERDEPAGVVLAPPPGWVPDLATQREVITALVDHPYVLPVTLGELFDSVPPATDADADAVQGAAPVVRELAPHDAAPFPIATARYRGAQRELAALTSSVGAEDPDVLRSTKALQLSLSTENTTEAAESDLAVVSDAANTLQQGITTSATRVTVTARKADIPLTFVNQTGKSVTVRVQLTGTKLLFPDGAERIMVLPEGATTTERFAVEARASGTFTMTVTLASADGNLRIGPPVRVSVRSAVFNGAGAALTAGALGFLLLWWGNHFRRTRRARRAPAST